MAEKKTKEQVEQEILKEATTAAAKEKKAEKPKASVKKPEPKKGLMEKAMDAVKPESKEEKEKPKITFERVYNVPLRQLGSRSKRSRRAVRDLRAFVQRHAKPDSIAISKEVNEQIFSRGFRKPPAHMRVLVEKDSEGKATVKIKE